VERGGGERDARGEREQTGIDFNGGKSVKPPYAASGDKSGT